ncbi:MAG: prepilin-type N-terminal cleavage/methylation domain-containing protein [Planctomycetota bacterium]
MEGHPPTEIRLGLPPRRQKPQGFTLVELTIVVLMLSILAALVVPKFAEGREQAEVAQIGTIMKTFAQAVQRYHTDHNAYPPDSVHRVFPPELEPYFGSMDMTTTPIGGNWDYENWEGRAGGPFLISVSIRSGDTSRYVEIDALLDDGDLATGGVREFVSGSPRLQFRIVPR